MSTKQELIDKQPRFWEMLAGGSTLTAACKAVRVHRATGRKWRLAAGGRIPRKRPVPSGRYLSLEDPAGQVDTQPEAEIVQGAGSQLDSWPTGEVLWR